MTIDSSWGSTHLQRSEIFREMFKEAQLEPTLAQQWVNWIGDIPGDSIRTQLKVNSIGELEVDTWEESKALPERRVDTGQFTFNIDEFKGVKTAFTDHFFETSFQGNQVLSATPTKMKRAHDVYMETAFLETIRDGQTVNDANLINNAKHRMVASGDGTGAPADSLTLADFSYANYALNQAQAPVPGRIAIVDPITAHNLNVKANIVDISNNPMWEGLVTEGHLDGTGLRFVRNIYGFDVYVSSFLPSIGTDEAALTTYKDVAATAADISGFRANYFMNIGGDASPVIGAMGRSPKFTSWRDEDIETEYHQLTQSFGFGLYRPENAITILSDTSAIA
jgi:hypothetical protein